MTNHEYHLPDDKIRNAIIRDELVDHYLAERDISYDGLITQLEQLGGRIAFHDNEQLAKIAAAFPARTTVVFSEQAIPDTYQAGTLTENAFLVPLASIDQPQDLYRPQLCVTIQDEHGIIDTLLFPIARRSSGYLKVIGIRARMSEDEPINQ